MKKNNSIIVSSENEQIIKELNKNIKEKIILLDKNILNLEKNIKKYKKILIYPTKFDIKNHEKEKLIFIEITKKYLNDINTIIIDTQEPQYARLFQNIKCEELINIFKNDIEKNINLLQNFLNYKNNTNIIILIHKEKNTKNNFLIIKSCINKFIIELMNNINKNNKNININCISTENIKLDYKKNIYPFKKNKSLKKISYLTKTLNFIMSKNIKNKIIIA